MTPFLFEKVTLSLIWFNKKWSYFAVEKVVVAFKTLVVVVVVL